MRGLYQRRIRNRMRSIDWLYVAADLESFDRPTVSWSQLSRRLETV